MSQPEAKYKVVRNTKRSRASTTSTGTAHAEPVSKRKLDASGPAAVGTPTSEQLVEQSGGEVVDNGAARESEQTVSKPDDGIPASVDEVIAAMEVRDHHQTGSRDEKLISKSAGGAVDDVQTEDIEGRGNSTKETSKEAGTVLLSKVSVTVLPFADLPASSTCTVKRRSRRPIRQGSNRT